MFIRIGIIMLFVGAMMGESESLAPALITMTLGALLTYIGTRVERGSEHGNK